VLSRRAGRLGADEVLRHFGVARLGTRGASHMRQDWPWKREYWKACGSTTDSRGRMRAHGLGRCHSRSRVVVRVSMPAMPTGHTTGRCSRGSSEVLKNSSRGRSQPAQRGPASRRESEPSQRFKRMGPRDPCCADRAPAQTPDPGLSCQDSGRTHVRSVRGRSSGIEQTDTLRNEIERRANRIAPGLDELRDSERARARAEDMQPVWKKDVRLAASELVRTCEDLVSRANRTLSALEQAIEPPFQARGRCRRGGLRCCLSLGGSQAATRLSCWAWWSRYAASCVRM